MRVLITRPESQARKTAARLRTLGHEPLVQPLLSIRYLENALPGLGGVQALAVTSGAVLTALPAHAVPRDLPLFAVGDATAQRALEEGFTQVESASGDAAALADLLIGRLNPADGTVLLPRGREVAGRLAPSLAGAGFTVRSAVLYESRVPDRLPEKLRTQLKEGLIEAAFFFSPRTARAFVTLTAEEELSGCTLPIAAFALSAAVAEALRPLPWGALRVAAAPTEDALFSSFEEFSR